MNSYPLQTVLLIILAFVFTIGLTFATVALPYIIDGLLMKIITTPAIDSHADEISVFKTDLYINHYKLRLLGYVCFSLTVLLIIAGFATRKSSLAAIGAVAFMLPVFAQFAGVMFFLAGLGVLNILWLPVLDISFEVQRLGLIIRAPYDLLMWLFRQIGVNAYWPLVCFFIGVGLLLFFLGTFAWLSAKARRRDVADFWVYKISRHPQYLGWILWSYGVFLLLMRGLYPKRSWGIDASLPWLLSTTVIVGVAMLEELNMRQQYGESYETYRQKTPFLFPVPKLIARFFALPFRVFYGKEQPERKGEVAVVLSLYTALLIGASAFFYGSGFSKTVEFFTPAAKQETRMEELATQLKEHPNRRTKYFIAKRLAAFGDAAVEYFIPLLKDEQTEVRILAAEHLGKIPSLQFLRKLRTRGQAQRAVPALVEALGDSVVNVRGYALRSLAKIGAREAAKPMMRLLDDPDEWVRTMAARSLAELGVEEIADRVIEGLSNPAEWIRIEYINALGTLGTEKGLPALMERLNDEEPRVRRAAVVTLIKIDSPAAREALQQASNDEDWEVRVYATEALKHLESAVRERP